MAHFDNPLGCFSRPARRLLMLNLLMAGFGSNIVFTKVGWCRLTL